MESLKEAIKGYKKFEDETTTASKDDLGTDMVDVLDDAEDLIDKQMQQKDRKFGGKGKKVAERGDDNDDDEEEKEKMKEVLGRMRDVKERLKSMLKKK